MQSYVYTGTAVAFCRAVAWLLPAHVDFKVSCDRGWAILFCWRVLFISVIYHDLHFSDSLCCPSRSRNVVFYVEITWCLSDLCCWYRERGTGSVKSLIHYRLHVKWHIVINCILKTTSSTSTKFAVTCNMFGIVCYAYVVICFYHVMGYIFVWMYLWKPK